MIFLVILALLVVAVGLFMLREMSLETGVQTADHVALAASLALYVLAAVTLFESTGVSVLGWTLLVCSVIPLGGRVAGA